MAKKQVQEEESLFNLPGMPKAVLVGCFFIMLGLACLATKSAGPLWLLVLLIFLGEFDD